MVIELIDENQSKVLWNGDYVDPWNRQISAGGGLSYGQIAKELVPIQEMPKGALEFYLDYSCGGNSNGSR